jgi:UDP-glucose 4-epimerase
MKILITGGCGFIGLNLIAFLKKNTRHHIMVLDNLSLGKREYLAGFDVNFVEGDIRDADIVKKMMKETNAVVHLAADTRVISSIENPAFNFDVNVNGTYNLLAMAKDHDVERFVFASTGGAIVGDAIPPVHEGMVPKPLSPYGASKLCGEAYCSAFAGSYGMKTVSLRFSNVYGPRSFHKGSVVAQFMKRILKKEPLKVYGDGEQTRDFVYVEDLCDAIESALRIDQGGNAYQLGTGVEISVNQLIEFMRNSIGEEYRISVEYVAARQGEVKKNYCDISLSRKVLNYKPETVLSEGLKKTWRWFLSQ